MQISISIEPFLAGDISILTNYLDTVVAFAREQPGVSLHFDYFQANPAVVTLLTKYASQIPIHVHLMSPLPLPPIFQSIAIDVERAGQAGATGIVLDLGCEIQRYEDLIRHSSNIIIMSVKCGKSGQTFNPSALDLVPQIRAWNPAAVLTIDGGVNADNIALVKKAGIDVVVVGNYAKKAFESGNFAKSLNRLLHV